MSVTWSMTLDRARNRISKYKAEKRKSTEGGTASCLAVCKDISSKALCLVFGVLMFKSK